MQVELGDILILANGFVVGFVSDITKTYYHFNNGLCYISKNEVVAVLKKKENEWQEYKVE